MKKKMIVLIIWCILVVGCFAAARSFLSAVLFMGTAVVLLFCIVSVKKSSHTLQMKLIMPEQIKQGKKKSGKLILTDNGAFPLFSVKGTICCAFEAADADAKTADADAKTADAKAADADAKTADAKTADADAKTADAKAADADAKTADAKAADADAKTADAKAADADAKTASEKNADTSDDAGDGADIVQQTFSCAVKSYQKEEITVKINSARAGVVHVWLRDLTVYDMFGLFRYSADVSKIAADVVVAPALDRTDAGQVAQTEANEAGNGAAKKKQRRKS